jgi:hypothetical protein
MSSESLRRKRRKRTIQLRVEVKNLHLNSNQIVIIKNIFKNYLSVFHIVVMNLLIHLI